MAIVKIPFHARVMSYSNKCLLFCSYGKLVIAHNLTGFWLFSMGHRQTISEEEMYPLITLWLVMACNIPYNANCPQRKTFVVLKHSMTVFQWIFPIRDFLNRNGGLHSCRPIEICISNHAGRVVVKYLLPNINLLGYLDKSLTNDR